MHTWIYYIIQKKGREISSEMHFWCKWKTRKQTKNSKVEVALAMRQMQMCENVKKSNHQVFVWRIENGM